MQQKYIQKLIDIRGRANISRNSLFNHLFIDLEPFGNSAAALRGSWQPSHYSWIGRRQCYLDYVAYIPSVMNISLLSKRWRKSGSQTDGVLVGRCVSAEVSRNVSKIPSAGVLGAWLLKHTSEARHNMSLILELWHSNVDALLILIYPLVIGREPDLFNKWQSVAGKLCSSDCQPDLTLWNRLSGWSTPGGGEVVPLPPDERHKLFRTQQNTGLQVVHCPY